MIRTHSKKSTAIPTLSTSYQLYFIVVATYETTFTWSGTLPPRIYKWLGLSTKVFVGGVPWDITEQQLIQSFKVFGPIKVEWPRKDQQDAQRKGYVYILFESEKDVLKMLQNCTSKKSEFLDTEDCYYKISSKRMKSKEVRD